MIGVILNKNVSTSNGLVNLPKLNLLNIDGKIVDNDLFNIKQPKIFVFFSTDCSACNDEIDLLYENRQLFKEVQISFISGDPLDTIRKFIPNGIDSVLVLHDINNGFSQKMGIKGFPSIFIFDKNNILTKKLTGAVPMHDILDNIPHEKKN